MVFAVVSAAAVLIVLWDILMIGVVRPRDGRSS